MRYLFYLYLILNPLFYVYGEEIRSSQEFFFQMSSLALIIFGQLWSKNRIKIDKVNLSLLAFVLWVFFIFLSFKSGWSIAFNTFLGAMVYFTTIRVFGKEDINSIIKCVSGIAAFAVFYLACQYAGWDMRGVSIAKQPGSVPHVSFFGLEAAFGMYLTLVIPLILSFSWVALLLLFPLIFSWSTAAYLSGIGSILFYFWFRKRKAFWGLLIPLIAIFIWFLVKIDSPMGMLDTRPKMWKLVIEDILKKPLMGYGLDSFREPAKVGQIRYMKKVLDDETIRAINTKEGFMVQAELSKETLALLSEKKQAFDFWDNPHNEPMLIAFETGVIGLLIFCGMIYFLWLRFIKSKMTPQIVGLFASIVSLCIFMQGHFPFHLARIAHFVPILCGLFYLSTDEDKI